MNYQCTIEILDGSGINTFTPYTYTYARARAHTHTNEFRTKRINSKIFKFCYFFRTKNHVRRVINSVIYVIKKKKNTNIKTIPHWKKMPTYYFLYAIR